MAVTWALLLYQVVRPEGYMPNVDGAAVPTMRNFHICNAFQGCAYARRLKNVSLTAMTIVKQGFTYRAKSGL